MMENIPFIILSCSKAMSRFLRNIENFNVAGGERKIQVRSGVEPIEKLISLPTHIKNRNYL